MSAVALFQQTIGPVKLSGVLGFRTAEAIFKNREWPEGCYFDLIEGWYIFP